MKFSDYYSGLSADAVRDLAERLDTSPAYVSQLASGHRKAGAKILVRIASATDGAVTPTDLRPDLQDDEPETEPRASGQAAA